MTKTSRNAPCPCGSGRKYKKCCLSREPADLVGAAMGSRVVETDLDALSNSVLDLVSSGDIEKAELACQELLARYPDQVDGLERYVVVCKAKGDIAGAVKYLREAAEFMQARPGEYDPEGIQYLLDEADALESSQQEERPSGEDDESFVGYAAFDVAQQCYEYNENACYIADSRDSMRRFLSGAMVSLSEYKVVPVSIADFERDFGVSCGQYALEPDSLARFKKAAQTRGMQFTVEPYDEPLGSEPELFIVDFVPRRGGWQDG